MQAREWLAQQGLAKAGARGKFSNTAKEALTKAIAEGMTFEDWNETGRVVNAAPKTRIIKLNNKQVAAPAVKLTDTVKHRREENIMSVVDTYGIRINFDYHYACGESISRCRCTNLLPPSWIDAASFELRKV